MTNSVPARRPRSICLIAGSRFGERWKNIAKAFGIESVNVTVPYGQAVQPGATGESGSPIIPKMQWLSAPR